MERCPVCRARLTTDPICGRCGTDFSQSLAVARQARQRLQQAIDLWCQGYLATALELLHQAEQLHHTPLTQALLNTLAELQFKQAIQALSQGQTNTALHQCQQILAVLPHHTLAYFLHGFISAHSVH